MANSPELSIIILTWNSRDHLRRCLESLARAGWFEKHAEIIVIDNGSVDGTADEVVTGFPGVSLLRNRRNRGVAAGRNQGVGVARGRYLMFLDVDTVVPAGSIEALLDAVQVPGVGVVGPRMIAPNGTLQHTGRRFPTVFGKLGRRLPGHMFRRWVEIEEMRAADPELSRAVDYVIGACQLIRREVVDEVGLLDERIFYGPEDVDFCIRARDRGWQVRYVPCASIVHAERRITRGLKLDRMTARHGLALAYFFAKHRYLLSRRRLYRRLSARTRQPVGAGNG